MVKYVHKFYSYVRIWLNDSDLQILQITRTLCLMNNVYGKFYFIGWICNKILSPLVEKKKKIANVESGHKNVWAILQILQWRGWLHSSGI
jgi:hypothetical protein